MHKITAALAMATALLGLSTQAAAVPIQVTGSELAVYGIGVGDYDYTGLPSALTEVADGDYTEITFGHVDILDLDCWLFDCGAAGGGVAQLTVQLASPILDGALATLAVFGVLSNNNDGYISVEWGAPTYINYSYGGSSGGLLALEMYDLGSLTDPLEFSGGFDLRGRIYNVESPTVAVPEPGILLLLGSGLLAAAAIRRRGARRA